MIRWYLNRLRTMSVAELFFRIRQWGQKVYEKHFVAGETTAPVTVSTKSTQLYIPFHLSGGTLFPDFVYIFGKQYKYINEETDWHKDIFSGRRFPLLFSKSINIIKDPELSAKNVWEINRLQFLIFIVLNYRMTQDRSYLDRFMMIVNSWVVHNPYLIGVNWYSNIEINIRLIVWFYCWILLDTDRLIRKDEIFRKFVENTWLPSIYQHCKYSYANPSGFSSSNNHLIAEYAGLFCASSLWKFKESERWKKYARKGLEREILRQHSKNGINKEEAAEYIQFITDFFLISYLTAERTGNPFSPGYRRMLKKIFYYISEFMDIKGNFPKYGDEDDGKCIYFDREPDHNNFMSLLTSGAILFRDPVLKMKSTGVDVKNKVLFGDEGLNVFNKLDQKKSVPGSTFYPEEGHFILRHSYGEKKEIYLHFDAAPLGFLSIAAHGHADALSFILHVNGHPVFVDPGTYTYHTALRWRKYFIGTLAHNTIRINRKDQAKNGGPTLWLNHYTTKVIFWKSTSEFDEVKAVHNGYKQFGISHLREIRFDKKNRIVFLTDTIEAGKNREYFLEQVFHFHPALSLKILGEEAIRIMTPGNNPVDFFTDIRLQREIVRGRIQPEILGWYSPSFLLKEPCDTVICSGQMKGPQKLDTVIKI